MTKANLRAGSVTAEAIELDELPTHGREQERAGRLSARAKRQLKDWASKWQRTNIEELLLRRKPLPPSKDGRHIPLRPGHQEPLVDERRGHAYISNSIRSARYTLWDFLPRQFFFQATRLHNFYFICIGVPQTIPGLSTTGNYTTILPLLFFMILTICKEGYDDYRRHCLDNVENNSFARILRRRQDGIPGSKPRESLWRMMSKSLFPALRFSPWTREPEAAVPNEDSETELDAEAHWARVKWHNITVGDIIKLRRNDVVPADIVLLHASGEDGLGYIETMALDGETSLKSRQAPHALQTCGTILGIEAGEAEFVLEDPNANLYEFNGRVTMDGASFPLTLNEVVYRGSVLRNTDTAIGVAINTGEECKIRMNANHHPKAKKPRLERYANQIVLTLILYVVSLSVGVSMGYLIWHNKTEKQSWYLNNAYVGFEEIIVGFLIMFNNVIPLALYVSLEIVKLGQQLYITSDVGMYDEDSNTPMGCNSNTILENLGQVGFVLSDKTGTLTQNVMSFRKMSVAGLVWTHRSSINDDAEPQAGSAGFVSKDDSRASLSMSNAAKTFALQPQRPSTTLRRSVDQAIEPQATTKNLLEHLQRFPASQISRNARHFILALALCHTALPETKMDGSVDFQASSPDELALVRAAQDLGHLVVTRSTQKITLLITAPDGDQRKESYDIMDVIEFSSKRKCMSVVVRCPDGNIWLICKGADSTLVPRLAHAELAIRKSREVRRSVQAERQRQRRSMQLERLSGVGAERPSVAIERVTRSTDVHRSMDLRLSFERSRLQVPLKQSFETGAKRQAQRTSSVEPPSDDAAVFSRTFKHLDEFATEGLRTLMFAHKPLTEAEYAAWKRLYTDASTSLINRQEKVEEAGEMIEQSLELLGASAIEDKLQTGVPETVEKLRRANIRIWMLTGDKKETAINIAHSARICLPHSDLFVLDTVKGDLAAQLTAISEEMGAQCVHGVVVVDGHTLAHIEDNSSLKQHFYSLIASIDSVICCRASPAQKASIVKLLPKYVPGALTLAIGDGANDIAMIQASHVGVGISGKEGLQAARVADYSIAQFRFLQRLLLVHGHWNYDRTAKFILWTFWKEMFFYMMQALYQRYNGYTGTSLYEMWSLTVLNTLFTSLCVIVPGILEQDLSADTLLAVPELYAFGQCNMGLNLPRYFMWVAGAAAEGIIVWFISLAAFGYLNKGDNGLFALGDLCFSLGIMWTNWKLLLTETHHKSVIVLIAFSITTGGWWAWNGFMSCAYSSNLSPYDVKGGFSHGIGRDGNWWLALIITLTILALLELSWKLASRLSASVRKQVGPWQRSTKYGRDRSERLEVQKWQELERDPAVRTVLREAAESGLKVDDEMEIVFSGPPSPCELPSAYLRDEETPVAARGEAKARPRVYERTVTES